MDHISGRLFKKLSVLNELLPLIRAGIVRFGRPGIALCEEHTVEASETVKRITHAILQEAAGGFQIVLREMTGPVDILEIQNPILLYLSNWSMCTLFGRKKHVE